jgi:hypothetical protein
MKSYYQHLKSTKEFGEKENLIKKPVLRSSAIFPVIQNQSYTSSIHFLGYWLLKRNISEVNLTITLRNVDGSLLLKKIQIIDTAKAFAINLYTLLLETNYNKDMDFIGSIETEFHTTEDMVFPYPALVLEYHNEEFNTCVHTLGRIYNDDEDMAENNENLVPETGFDIHETSDLHSFLSFVNGSLQNEDGYIEYVITNSNSKQFSGHFHLGKITPFETKFLYLKDHIPDLSKILDSNSGSISIKHNFEGFYPRFLVGNVQESFPSVSFTHSYYDNTNSTNESNYWNRTNDSHFDSSIYVPIFQENNQFTNLIVYPNLSPSDSILKIDIYDEFGNKVYENSNFLTINSAEKKLTKINLNNIVSNLDSFKKKNFAAHIITNFKNNKIPTRIKFGLDVGTTGLNSKLPCNICFNMRLGNPLLENKPGSFHWAPLFHNRNTVFTLGNFSTLKNYNFDANLELNFYRIEDSSSFNEKIQLKANSEKRISFNDFQLNEFLKSEGWVTIKADTPYIHGYYFNMNSSGSVAGDHLF